ncbi:MAG: PEP/pyruvate-binding domain-containing protein [Candidatus Heimdallarchaeaceae archaeon]
MATFTDDESFFMEYKPKFKVFHELMAKRMSNVLLVSSIYDSFMLEEDGRLSDQIYEEFHNLNLRTLPRITRVSSAKEALILLQEKHFDLVITMRRLGDMDVFSFGKSVKEIKDIPVILLLNSVVEIKYIPDISKREGIDRTFVWNGDSKIFVAIIKHLEDNVNAEYDTKAGHVKVFIFVEDSIRFYSLLLPEMYGEIMRQTHRLITEGTNDFQDLLKMRIRPKIILAENYEEAMYLYKKYKRSVLGIVCDVEFPRNNVLDKQAGFLFVKKVKEDYPNMPIIMQSSKEKYREKALKKGIFFLYKGSHKLLTDLRRWLLDRVGFGDFVFRDANGKEIGRASDIINFYKEIERVPFESLAYHGQSDYFSNWLSARGEFEIAEKLRPRKVSEFVGEELRNFLLTTIKEVVIEKTRGIVNDFSRENYHSEILFLRLRPGSLGGKGRGLAFLMFLINSLLFQEEFKNISIEIPQTIVIGTDEYDRFMEDNNLLTFAVSGASDQQIKEKFAKSKLSKSIRSDLKFLLKDIDGPIAVRSSSLLEDSAWNPFAGIFNTYMIPNNANSENERLNQLCTAIKLVYASQFLSLAMSYAETINQTIEESKMAVVIQQVVGKEHNNRLYPDFSGTASSYNYYPFGEYMQSEDRIAHVALGLGKTIVDGESALRFCPKYPKMNFYSTPEILLKQSQRHYYAVDLTRDDFDILEDDPYLVKLNLSDAITDGTLSKIADTYDFNSETLNSGFFGEGSPVITFNNQLKFETFPLAKLITKLLSVGEKAFGSSIEIEYACNFGEKKGDVDTFHILQIRPFLYQELISKEDFESVDLQQVLAYSTQVSGNLIMKDVKDIIYVKPEMFDKTATLDIVEEIDELNAKMLQEKRPYLLMGFGRWGTADRFLGIPVKWNNINGAKTIIEATTEDFSVDFSQGSHFFHNIVTANIGYFHIKHNSEQHKIDWDWLASQKSINDLEYIRHVRNRKPLTIIIDAQRGEGMIIKPNKNKKKKRKENSI